MEWTDGYFVEVVMFIGGRWLKLDSSCGCHVWPRLVWSRNEQWCFSSRSV